ncbi:MAG: carboxypeptidase regulatory-like domain-containing protein [Pseudomonadota bacterium]
MNAVQILPGLLTLTVALGWVRLAWWQYRAPAAARSRGWRLAILAVAQPISAALLYLTLVPPALPTRRGTLVVATAGTPRLVALGGDERLVTLPESDIRGGERVPDLATALRRYPGTARLRVVGGGLTPRDEEVARTRSLAFVPPPPPRGLIALAPPGAVAPGAPFQIGGQAAGLGDATVELLDPAGQRVDVRPVAADGTFIVTGTARGAGAVTFTLKLRDGRRAVVAAAVVPVETVAAAPPRLLVLAGAPGPEIKYLRRWATEAGLPLNVQLNLGGGMALGDPPVAINAATLARFDAVVVDERSWAGLGAGGQGALRAAVRGGLGLVLRVTGPLPDAVRRQWQGFGFVLGSGVQVAPVKLAPAAPDAAALAARRGTGSRDVAPDAEAFADEPPPLSRRVMTLSGPDIVPVARDASGAAFAAWRPVGRGRVAVWNLPDSFALVVTGQGDRYGEYWSATVAAVARAGAGPTARFESLARVGERTVICGLTRTARVTGPGGAVRSLIVGGDGCAGFWPRAAGWHSLERGGANFFVQDVDALPGVRAEARRVATLTLVGERSTPGNAASPPGRSGSWPWFLAWLAVSAGLWWFERARFGRIRPAS